MCNTTSLKGTGILEHLSGVEPSTQFTVEVESEGKFPFPDVVLQQDPDGSISATVYRKATHMDCYFDVTSHHPLAYKLAVVRALHSRADAVCSDVTAKDQETRHIRQAFIINGYPKGLVQQVRPEPADDPIQGLVITLPYA